MGFSTSFREIQVLFSVTQLPFVQQTIYSNTAKSISKLCVLVSSSAVISICNLLFQRKHAPGILE